MQANVGTIDRALRVFFGLLLILLSVFHVIGPWGWLGLIAITTGVIRFCPAYKILGLRTCPKPE